MKTLLILLSATFLGASILGFGLANRATAVSSSGKEVVAVCGPNGAVQLVEADKVPVGCHVSRVNSPPAGR